jgi:hypothetical protein
MVRGRLVPSILTIRPAAPCREHMRPGPVNGESTMGVWMPVLASLVLAHGGNGDWDDYALLLLAPLVIAGVLWVTRRTDGDADESPEGKPD